MLSNVNRRFASGERGFTLIELLVVMIIIAILLAIAIPMFLGQRQRAVATEAKANNRSVLTAVQSCLTNDDISQCVLKLGIDAEEPSLQSATFYRFGCTGAQNKPCIIVSGNQSVGFATAATDTNYVIHSLTKVEKGIRLDLTYNSTNGVKQCFAVTPAGTAPATVTSGSAADLFFKKICPAQTTPVVGNFWS